MGRRRSVVPAEKKPMNCRASSAVRPSYVTEAGTWKPRVAGPPIMRRVSAFVRLAGSEKVAVWPPPVRTKSSMVSAWAVRVMDKAEARIAKAKRVLRMSGSLLELGEVRVRSLLGCVK